MHPPWKNRSPDLLGREWWLSPLAQARLLAPSLQGYVPMRSEGSQVQNTLALHSRLSLLLGGILEVL